MDWNQIELEQLRQEKEETLSREREERERRAQERKEEIERIHRSADNWPEALRKQIHLFGREIAQEVSENAKWGYQPENPNDPLETFFIDGKAACERALQIWAEVEKVKAAKREELERQLAALDEEVKEEVANRLEKESARCGWIHVANAIRSEDPENWLQW